MDFQRPSTSGNHGQDREPVWPNMFSYPMEELDTQSTFSDDPPFKRTCSNAAGFLGVRMMSRKVCDNYSHRDEEQKKLKIALTSEDSSCNSIKAAICGPPGVGKSELAISVITETYHHFDHILWINCTSEDTIKVDLSVAANLLEIPLFTGISIQLLIHKIYQHCSSYKVLFIFDNVTDQDKFQNLLPNYIANTSSIFILVTSFYRDWDAEFHIHVKAFDITKCQTFLKKLIPEITNSQSSKLSCYLGGIPFVLQLAVAYIKKQRELRQLETVDGSYDTEDFIKDLIRGTRNLRQYKLNDCDKIGYTKSLETLYENLITNLKNKSDLAYNLFLKINFIKYDDIPITLFKFKSENDLNINEAFLLLEKYSVITCTNQKFERSYFLPYVALYNFSREDADMHKLNLYNLFLEKCVESSTYYDTLMLENPIYLPHLKKLFQALTTSPLLKTCSKVPFIIVNSEIMDYEETIQFIGSYYRKLDTLLGWDDVNYIGIQTILIKSHFKLKHHSKVIELCEIAKQKMPEQYKELNFNLHILHYKASSLHKLGHLKDAYILIKDVFERKIVHHGSVSADYLISLRRLCAIVAKLYQDGDTISLTLFKTICDNALVTIPSHFAEKIQFVNELEKYFSRMGRQDDLIPIFDHFLDFLVRIKGTDSNISFLLIVVKACYLCSIGFVDEAWNLCNYLIDKLGLIQIFAEQPSQIVMLDFIESLEGQVNERLHNES